MDVLNTIRNSLKLLQGKTIIAIHVTEEDYKDIKAELDKIVITKAKKTTLFGYPLVRCSEKTYIEVQE